jgi:hypothetical protein
MLILDFCCFRRIYVRGLVCVDSRRQRRKSLEDLYRSFGGIELLDDNIWVFAIIGSKGCVGLFRPLSLHRDNRYLCHSHICLSLTQVCLRLVRSVNRPRTSRSQPRQRPCTILSFFHRRLFQLCCRSRPNLHPAVLRRQRFYPFLRVLLVCDEIGWGA